MSTTQRLQAARAAVDNLEERRDQLLAAANAADAKKNAAIQERAAMIRRAAVGDKAVTAAAIRKMDDVQRESEIAAQIEREKVKAIADDIEAAELEVLRAEAEAHGERVNAAFRREADAFKVFFAKAREAQVALASYRDAVAARDAVQLQAANHNRRADVLNIADPDREKRRLWQEPRPVTITVGDGPSVTMNASGNLDVVQSPDLASATPGDRSVLADISRPRYPGLGDVCCANYQYAAGWKVDRLHELQAILDRYQSQV